MAMPRWIWLIKRRRLRSLMCLHLMSSAVISRDQPMLVPKFPSRASALSLIINKILLLHSLHGVDLEDVSLMYFTLTVKERRLLDL